MPLYGDEKGNIIQAFPLVKGRTNKTTGAVVSNCYGVQCVEDGSFSVDTLADTIVMLAGDVNALPPRSKVTIVSGKFHLA